MASFSCHVARVTKRRRLERIVRPQHATGMSGPQDLCLEWRRSQANRARGTGTIRARTCRSRTLLKRGASDGPLGLAEAWTTGQELNRAVANQPKFEIASGAANAKIEVGPHSFAFQRPNTRVKPTREAGSAWTNCYARQGKPEASGPQRVGESREQGQSHRQPGTGRGQQEPKPTVPQVRRS